LGYRRVTPCEDLSLHIARADCQAKSFRLRHGHRGGFVLIVSAAASMLISIRGRLIGRFLPASPQVLETLNIAISNWILAILFALIFRLVPDVRLPWKPIFVGAVLTATLFTAGRGVLDLYLATANVGSMYGAAGSLVVIVMWVYYSAQILLFGAEFTKVHADSR
jgi:membrane protein